MDVAYDGAPFRGWARQAAARTVQGELEAALEQVLGVRPDTVGAGRTDAGVHALGQVMGVPRVPDDADLVALHLSLNRLCGPSIAVNRVLRAPEEWHARFSALSRTYVYAVLQAPVHDPWLAGTSLHHPGPLDVAAMNEACGHLVGEHDFSTFGRVAEGLSPERHLWELRWIRRGHLLTLRARASSFIGQMVRSLAGTLIRVGEGRSSPDDMLAVLAGRDRGAAGPVAPPHGLCLVSVEYDAGWSRPFDPYG
ncbi:MAG: tRNA pseudouridine(38-40) synthase TruA [Actinomycetota bacterium]|nr:tRNA pseudouridine(38-40) synthase TruA [Actinomycetota bacterium]